MPCTLLLQKMNKMTKKLQNVNEAFKKGIRVLFVCNLTKMACVLHSAHLLNVLVTNSICFRDDIHVVLICNVYYSYGILVETETDLKKKQLRSSISF